MLLPRGKIGDVVVASHIKGRILELRQTPDTRGTRVIDSAYILYPEGLVEEEVDVGAVLRGQRYDVRIVERHKRETPLGRARDARQRAG